jgi:hypothetical protein
LCDPKPYNLCFWGQREDTSGTVGSVCILSPEGNKDVHILSREGNAQVALLSDVARYRCSATPSLGMPGRISTVDKYQGQVCGRAYVCIYIRMYIHTYVPVRMYTYIHTYIQSFFHAFIRIYIRVYRQTDKQTSRHPDQHTHTNTHTHTHTHTHTLRLLPGHVGVESMRVTLAWGVVVCGGG